MKKYKKYIIFSYLANYLRVSILLSCIMLMIQSVNLLDDISHKAAVGFGAMLPMMGLIFLNVFYVSSLIASVLAAIISIFSISSSSETTILKNAGLTSTQIIQPVIYTAGIITLVMYIFAFFIIPFSFASINERINNIYHKHMSNIVKPNKIVQLENSMIYIKTLDDNSASIFLARYSDGLHYIYVPEGKFWVTNSMIGLLGTNTIIESFSNTEHSRLTFKNFESQINFIDQNTRRGANSDLKIQNIVSLFSGLKQADSRKRQFYIEEINLRLSLPLLNVVLPVAIYSFFLKFYSIRRKVDVIKTLTLAISIGYIIGSYHMFPVLFSSHKTIPIIYTNILLTFLSAILLSTDFYRKHGRS